MLALVLALATSPSATDEGSQTAQPVQQTETKGEEADKPAKICRKVAEGMNSRRKVEMCMTAQEWRKFNQGN
jgi:translation elongation factor EF-Ts